MIYSILLAPLAVSPWIVGLGGWVYLAVSTSLGLAFIWQAMRVYRVRKGHIADVHAKRLFGFSIFYLFALFAVLLGEHTIARIIN